jgi:predicted acylesterase/phospholipase RssA
MPPALLKTLWRSLADAEALTLLGWVERLGRAMPTGVFDGRAIDRYLRRLFSAPGRTNDFRQLRRHLYQVATELDSGTSVEFGAPGHEHVPISTAVQASGALPGLFPPTQIEGRHFVDGALKKTLHASVALKHGARLVLCINPLVPFDSEAVQRHPRVPARLVQGGLPAVLAQTFRAIVHSRMQVGMQRYAAEYKHADVVLFEPDRQDAEMFVTNIFSYASRRRLAEHAYQKTRQELHQRRHELAPILKRHGITLDLEAIADPQRKLVRQPHHARRPTTAVRTAHRLEQTLDTLERWLERGGRRG